MTGLAVGRGMCSLEWIHAIVVEPGLEILAAHPVPVVGGMAARTGRLHSPVVRIGMAVGAAGEPQPAIGTTRIGCVGAMTRIALHRAVATGQRVSSLLVIEGRPGRSPIRLIVAVGARFRIEPACVRVVGLMAARTGGIETQERAVEGPVLAFEGPYLPITNQRRLMAGLALESGMTPLQRVRHVIVVEPFGFPANQVVVGALVVLMARGAGLIIGAPMQPGSGSNSTCEWLMAGQAAFRRDATGSQLVTFCAVPDPLELAMGRGQFSRRDQLCPRTLRED
ncbi:MAG: hypothetical protein OEM96_01860 [Gemmatimonadota bacterium]|nr:hypothetical protein [Gemmatimonadota bacterium]